MATAATSERRERHACDVANDDTWPLQHYRYDRYTERPMHATLLPCYYHATRRRGRPTLPPPPRPEARRGTRCGCAAAAEAAHQTSRAGRARRGVIARASAGSTARHLRGHLAACRTEAWIARPYLRPPRLASPLSNGGASAKHLPPLAVLSILHEETRPRPHHVAPRRDGHGDFDGARARCGYGNCARHPRARC